jgi:hypothetical protein
MPTPQRQYSKFILTDEEIETLANTGQIVRLVLYKSGLLRTEEGKRLTEPQICKELDISESEMRRLVKSQEYAKKREEIVTRISGASDIDAVAGMAALVPDAIDTLYEILQSPRASFKVRLDAAMFILNNAASSPHIRKSTDEDDSIDMIEWQKATRHRLIIDDKRTSVNETETASDET